MRILLLGASGRSGSLALAEALSRNHTVTALVRRPDALPPQPNLSLITGTPLNPADISRAFADAPKSDPVRAVISTLNTGRTSDNPWAKATAPPALMADSVRNALGVMREHGVKKMVVLGTNGVGSSRASGGWFFNWVVDHSNLKIAFDDHYEVQKVLEAEAEKDGEFKWVDVRATGLSNGEKKEVKEFGNEGKGVGWFVSRKSVAGFLLDAVEGSLYQRQDANHSPAPISNLCDHLRKELEPKGPIETQPSPWEKASIELTIMSAEVMHKGSCHCKAVTFEVLHSPNLELSFQGFVIEKPALKSLEGKEHLEIYKFGTGTAQHMFCRICGISPLTVPRSYPEGYNINYRCLERDNVRSINVTPKDGQNWEQEMAKGNLG